jgi:hypothetical protein
MGKERAWRYPGGFPGFCHFPHKLPCRNLLQAEAGELARAVEVAEDAARTSRQTARAARAETNALAARLVPVDAGGILHNAPETGHATLAAHAATNSPPAPLVPMDTLGSPHAETGAGAAALGPIDTLGPPQEGTDALAAHLGSTGTGGVLGDAGDGLDVHMDAKGVWDDVVGDGEGSTLSALSTPRTFLEVQRSLSVAEVGGSSSGTTLLSADFSQNSSVHLPGPDDQERDLDAPEHAARAAIVQISREVTAAASAAAAASARAVAARMTAAAIEENGRLELAALAEMRAEIARLTDLLQESRGDKIGAEWNGVAKKRVPMCLPSTDLLGLAMVRPWSLQGTERGAGRRGERERGRGLNFQSHMAASMQHREPASYSIDTCKIARETMRPRVSVMQQFVIRVSKLLPGY